MILLADIFETIVGSLFLILWIAGQLLGGRKEAKPKKNRPRPQRPQPVDMAERAALPRDQGPRDQGPRDLGPRDRGPRDLGPRNQEEALRSEVEDFLRRAQGKPPKPKPAQQPQPTVELTPLRQAQPRQTLPEPQRREPVAPVEARTLRTEGVAEHVARHLSTQDIAEHTKTLGATVATSDDRLESHLHERFDHELGSLQHRDAPAENKPMQGDIAAEIAAMLQSPQGMRQLIVANEILRRPEW